MYVRQEPTKKHYKAEPILPTYCQRFLKLQLYVGSIMRYISVSYFDYVVIILIDGFCFVFAYCLFYLTWPMLSSVKPGDISMTPSQPSITLKTPGVVRGVAILIRLDSSYKTD
jgi:hypothetical protein